MWFWKAGYTLLMATRLYLVWSKLYRKLYHRKYEKKYKVDNNLKPWSATQMAKQLTWVRDGRRELWDAIGSPCWVEYCVREVTAGRKQPKGSLDCDEFAVWCASRIRLEFEPIVLNVFWRDGKKRSGHNLCMFRRDGSYFHTGNWGKHGPFVSLSATVEDVLLQKGLGPEDLIGWSLYDPKKLKLKKYGTEI